MNYPCLRSVVAVLGLAVVAGLGGCGLISSDVTNFDLTLSPKKFTIDATRWTVDQDKANTYLSMSCASNMALCSSAVQLACTKDCSGTCNARQTCDLALDIALSQPVDLVSEQPELKSINDEPVIKVSIDSVTYLVSSNSLNVATPEIQVYVAPMSVMKPPATLIGTIPSIAAGQVVTSPQALQFTPDGKKQLIDIMSSFKTPFNVLVGSSLLVTAGQQMPMGKLEAVVNITGHAGL
jgi:hypothetical protein